MNIKRFIGVLLTTIGITGLIYPIVMFFINTEVKRDGTTLAGYGLIGFLCLISGISLVRATRN